MPYVIVVENFDGTATYTIDFLEFNERARAAAYCRAKNLGERRRSHTPGAGLKFSYHYVSPSAACQLRVPWGPADQQP